jgi:NADH dehydrogenase [ubiquinone] 1 alpha subcomplex assembly factor 7
MASGPDSPDDPGDRRTDQALREIVVARLERTGLLTFPEFLSIVLHEPSLGYYERARPILGRAGDFTTASQLHDLLGWTLAEEAIRCWSDLECPEDFQIVELGPGEGHLMKAMGDWLRAKHLPLDRWSVYLVETSPTLRRAQERRVSGIRGLRWVGSVSEIPPGPGFWVGSEFLDALPFHILVSRGGSWKEVYVGRDRAEGQTLTAREGPLSSGLPPGELPDLAPDGVRMEFRPALGPLMREIRRSLARGRVVFLDYGAHRERLWGDHPGGTLEVYHRHQVSRDPFSDLGSRDISAWVDFTHVQKAAKVAGLDPDPLRSQAEFLWESGMPQVLDRLDILGIDETEKVRARLAMKSYLFAYPTFQAQVLRAHGP